MDRDALLALARDHGAEVRFGEPMWRHTSLRIGGEAEFFLRPSGWACVPGLLEGFWASGLPFRVMGGGTNLLVQDGPLGFGVLALGRCGGSVRWEGSEGEADADVPLPALCIQATRRGLSGLEGMEDDNPPAEGSSAVGYAHPVPVASPKPAAAPVPPVAPAVNPAADPLDYRDLFKKFIDARQQSGESIQGLVFEAFKKKLNDQLTALNQK